ncbi:hypothetical protein POM88_026442 [Heracleum sosnowskyi]|uniref:Uncharacterized protein n=1 Tax=Heracleum sosnowskyi TaxID=360622 RepID=A0AAD8MPZ4_9APIA|nr:hypothetical protein POM88_026442 [Heracleum sosnowskyi]
MSNESDVNVCFCNKVMVERMCWYGSNAGRRSLNCPDGSRGCGYIHWIEEPLEERAAIIIEDLKKQMTRQANQHVFEMEELMHSFNISILTDSGDDDKDDDDDDDEGTDEDDHED